MLFDLRKYFSAGVSPSERHLTVDLSGRDFSGARIPQPVEAIFTAVRLADGIELHLQAQAEIEGVCAPCLDPVRQKEEINVVFPVKQRDLDDADFELPLGENGALDVEEWVFQEFLFQVPTVLLCSPDCLGLCPVCGKKRQDCTCQTAAESTPADARLSILKSLLN